MQAVETRRNSLNAGMKERVDHALYASSILAGEINSRYPYLDARVKTGTDEGKELSLVMNDVGFPDRRGNVRITGKVAFRMRIAGTEQGNTVPAGGVSRNDSSEQQMKQMIYREALGTVMSSAGLQDEVTEGGRGMNVHEVQSVHVIGNVRLLVVLERYERANKTGS